VHAKTLKPGEWLIGGGWDQNDWPEKNFPSAADLDAAFPDRPVWLSRVDGHAGWANSAAMRAVRRSLAGAWQPMAAASTATPPASRPACSSTTRCCCSSRRVRRCPRRPEHALRIAMRAAASHGLTGVHDAGISLAELRRFQRLADRGQLPLRITAMADGDSDALESLCRDGLYRHRSGRLQMRTVKLYADGALGSRGAAMLEDYSDDHGNRGLMVMSPAQLATAAAKAKRCGVQAATHAIGDRGNRETLDVYAKAFWCGCHGRSSLAHRARAGACAAGPAAACGHARDRLDAADPRDQRHAVGAGSGGAGAHRRRLRLAAAARQWRAVGAGLGFPGGTVDPRLGLASAVTRADAEGLPAGGWYPNEKLTAYEALRGFTLDAAYAGFAEAEVGSLQAGKRADFVVLGEDPLAVPGEALRALTVLATYVDGEPVYEAGKSSAASP
jgi:predicted amidohydrolase YtcJ